MRMLQLAALLSIALPASAFALNVKVEKPLPSNAAAAWKTVGDFCGIAKWHPAVEACKLSEKDGKTFRELTLKGGAKLLEELVRFDDAGKSYTYTIVEGPLPVANYKSTLSIEPAGATSSLSWTGTFDAKGAPDAEAVKTITGIYQAGAEALAAKK